MTTYPLEKIDLVVGKKEFTIIELLDIFVIRIFATKKVMRSNWQNFSVAKFILKLLNLLSILGDRKVDIL